MNERSDDIVRKQMEGMESPVPKGMFDKIQTHPDVSDTTFDAGLRNKLQFIDSTVPAGIFDKISVEVDITNAPFDGAIAHKLDNYESAVPADMWERIMQNKRRRRPVAWWWMAASLLLLLGSGTWYIIQRLDPTTSKVGQQLQPDRSDILINKGKLNNKVPVSKDVTAIQPDSVYAQHQLTVKKHTTNSQLSSKTSINPTDELKSINKTESNIYKCQKEPYNYENKAKNKKALLGANKYESLKEVQENDESMGIISNIEIEENQSSDFTATLNNLHLVITQQLRNAARLLPAQLLKAKPHSPVIPCPANDDDYGDWFVDVYTSAFLVNKRISDKVGTKNAENGFDSTLHRQVSYNAGVNIAKKIGENVLIKTGVQYNRLNESFRLTRINERKLVTTISVRTVIISPGDTVYIRDTTVTEHIGTIQRRQHNTYKQWDVPLIIGYEFGGENIRLNANAGIIANIRSSYNGEMLDTLQQIIDTKNYNGKPVYKTNVGLSIYAGISIVKPLGERTSLLIEPFARIGLGNTTTENAWFQQKNNSAGLSIGLRYKLNGGQR